MAHRRPTADDLPEKRILLPLDSPASGAKQINLPEGETTFTNYRADWEPGVIHLAGMLSECVRIRVIVQNGSVEVENTGDAIIFTSCTDGTHIFSPILPKQRMSLPFPIRVYFPVVSPVHGATLAVLKFSLTAPFAVTLDI